MSYPKSPEEVAFLMESDHPTIKDPGAAYVYARDVIKGRWPEAEPIILKDPYGAYVYARDVIKGRWPEAEPTILKDSNVTYYYLMRVVKGRWPELEKVLHRIVHRDLDDLDNLNDEFSDGHHMTWHDVDKLYTHIVGGGY